MGTNLRLDACADDDLKILGKLCTPTWWIRISLLSKFGHENFLLSQGLNNLITVIFCIFYLQYFRYKQRLEADRCDKKLLSASDFAIEVRGLPVGDTMQDIRREFEKKLEQDLGYKDNFTKLVLVNRTFAISDLMQVVKKQSDFVKQKIRLERWIKTKEKENVKKSMKVKQSEKQLNQLKIELNDSYIKRNLMEEDLKKSKTDLQTKENLFKNQLKFTGTAYIVFQTPVG